MNQVVVCGLGRFGLQVVESLRAAGADVTVVSDGRTPQDRLDRVRGPGVRVVIGDFRLPSARREAGVAAARAVLLTTSSDVDNLEAALEIRGEAAHIPVVMRHSAPRLTCRFESDFGISAVLAPAELAAEAFVAAALESPDAVGDVRPRRAVVPMPRRRLRAELVAIPLLLATLYFSAIVIFRYALGLGWLDAAYFATSVVTTVGFGDFNLRDSPAWVKLFGIVLMFGGILLVGMIASLLTIFVVSGAARQLRNELLAGRRRGHVIVCGMGLTGVAVARDLCRRGVPVVGVDPRAHDDDRMHDASLRCPLIAGDATSTTALVKAGVDRARAVVACTSNDALNLEIGLTAQTAADERRAGRPLRIVLRCFDADLARRIHATTANYTLLSEAKIAAPHFVRKALGR